MRAPSELLGKHLVPFTEKHRFRKPRHSLSKLSEKENGGTSPPFAIPVLGNRSDGARIVRAFAGDRDVVGVAFAQARAGDAHEGRALLEVLDGCAANIAHGR